MRRRVYRSIVTVTVLAREDDRYDYADPGLSARVTGEDSGEGGLDALSLDINSGPCLGTWSQSPWEPVPDEEVETACQAMGNDGTFFDEDEEALRMFEEAEAEIDRVIEATRRREQMHVVADGAGPKVKNPTFTLAGSHDRGPTIEQLLDMFRALTGREPSPEDIEDARARLAAHKPRSSPAIEGSHHSQRCSRSRRIRQSIQTAGSTHV